jgi:hypothetical protein
MPCGCQKDAQSCASCLYGRRISSPWVVCDKLNATGGAPLRMVRGSITTFSDGTRRVQSSSLCTEWVAQDAQSVPA